MCNHKTFNISACRYLWRYMWSMRKKKKKLCCCMFPKFGCGGRSGESVDHILDLDRGELKDAVHLLNAGRGFVSRVVGGSHV